MSNKSITLTSVDEGSWKIKWADDGCYWYTSDGSVSSMPAPMKKFRVKTKLDTGDIAIFSLESVDKEMMKTNFINWIGDYEDCEWDDVLPATIISDNLDSTEALVVNTAVSLIYWMEEEK